MGMTQVPVRISNPGYPKKTLTLDFLVDSGAVYSVVPGKHLKALDMLPEDEREFILANGQKMKRKLGIARFMYKGRTGGAPVIFGETGDSTLLGATTLEALGFVLDPFKRDLLPLPMVIG